MTDKIINGHLVQNAEGAYLSKDYTWFPHNSVQEAYVHPDGNLAMILSESKEWPSKPTFLIPAIYSPSSGVSIKTEPLNVHGLSLVDVIYQIMINRKMMENKK